MTEQDLLDDDLLALDRAAGERGAAALTPLQAAVERLRGEGDRDRLARALPPLARALALREKFDEAEVTIRLSAGIAEATAPCDAPHLFKRADEALHAAKAAGRDAVHYDIQDARHG
jgi:GGDEF domain-containing protein